MLRVAAGIGPASADLSERTAAREPRRRAGLDAEVHGVRREADRAGDRAVRPAYVRRGQDCGRELVKSEAEVRDLLALLLWRASDGEPEDEETAGFLAGAVVGLEWVVDGNPEHTEPLERMRRILKTQFSEARR